MTNVEKLKEIIGKGRINIFPGTNPNATEEEIAGEVLKALKQFADGTAEEIDLDELDR